MKYESAITYARGMSRERVTSHIPANSCVWVMSCIHVNESHHIRQHRSSVVTNLPWHMNASLEWVTSLIIQECIMPNMNPQSHANTISHIWICHHICHVYGSAFSHVWIRHHTWVTPYMCYICVVCVHLCYMCVHMCNICVRMCYICVHMCNICVHMYYMWHICVHMCYICVHMCCICVTHVTHMYTYVTHMYSYVTHTYTHVTHMCTYALHICVHMRYTYVVHMRHMCIYMCYTIHECIMSNPWINSYMIADSCIWHDHFTYDIWRNIYVHIWVCSTIHECVMSNTWICNHIWNDTDMNPPDYIFKFAITYVTCMNPPSHMNES